MSESCCNTCQKPQDQLTIPLKRCAKCKTQQYCSRECQKADWKRHKPNCKGGVPSDAPAPTTSSTNSSNASNTTARANDSPCKINKPFTALDNGTWLHNRPEKDVFKLLIDVYRMRVEDEYKFGGEVEEGSLYSGASSAETLDFFRRFLVKATKIDGKREANKRILPEWWSQAKLGECLTMALSDAWSSVGLAIEKHDVTEHYKDPTMPMQLRMFGEKLDGTLTAGQSCKGMLQVQVMGEQGELAGMHSSLLSLGLN